MTPEEQYVKCMDAAYAAADEKTCFRMLREAEGVLRGEGGTKPAVDDTSDEELAA